MPKPDFKNLFTNKKDFPDDFQITLANGAVVTMGDLREYNDAVGGDLAKEFKAKEADLVKRSRTVEAATNRVAHIITELQNGRIPDDAAELGIKLPAKRAAVAADDRNNSDPFAAYENDPYVQPLLSEMRRLQGVVDNFQKTQVEPLKRSLGEASLAFINRESQRVYDALPFKELGDKVGDEFSLQNLMRYAVENNLMTRDKLPDIAESFNKLAGPKLTEKRLKDAEDRGYKRRDAEIADGLMMPGAGGRGLPEPTGPKPVETKGKRADQILSEQLSNAAKDKELWRGIVGVTPA